jgi:hypothetical protein
MTLLIDIQYEGRNLVRRNSNVPLYGVPHIVA